MKQDTAKYNPIITVEETAAGGRQSDVSTNRVEPRVSDASVQIVLDSPKHETEYYASKDNCEKTKERIASGCAGERTYKYEPEHEGIHKHRKDCNFKLPPGLDSLLESKDCTAVNIIIYKLVQFTYPVRTRLTNDLKGSKYKAEEEPEDEDQDSGSKGGPDTPAEQTPDPNTGPGPEGPNAGDERQPASAARGGNEHKQPSRTVSDPGPHSTQEVNAACGSGVQCGQTATFPANHQEFLTTIPKASKPTLLVHKWDARQEGARTKQDAEGDAGPIIAETNEQNHAVLFDVQERDDSDDPYEYDAQRYEQDSADRTEAEQVSSDRPIQEQIGCDQHSSSIKKTTCKIKPSRTRIQVCSDQAA